MRRFALLVTTTALIAAPAMAADAKPNIAGFTPCGRPFACSTYSGLESSDPRIVNLIAQASSCIGKYFGMNSPEGYFRNELGLGYNNCLTTKPQPKASTGSTPTPSCCIVPTEGDNCQLRCEVLAVR